ncbi:MAG: TolC family protein [Bacteroidota bacterium]
MNMLITTHFGVTLNLYSAPLKYLFKRKMYKSMNMSKKLIKRYLFLFFAIFCFMLMYFKSYSQNTDKQTLIDPISTDIVNIIPPLSILIDSALNSPSMKAKQAELSYRKSVITTTKRNLLKGVGFQTYYNYGNTDVFSLSNSSSSVNSLLNATSQTSTSYYGVGASLRYSLFDIIEQKNAMKINKILYEESYYTTENEKLVIRKQIITQYYGLILLQKELKLSHLALIDAQTQTVMAEKEFSQGEISISELASLRDMKLKTQIQADTYFSEFMIAYTLLQDLTGIRFANLKIIE